MAGKRKAKKDAGDGSDGRRITPSKAKNAMNVAKIVAPTVIPAVAPFVLRAAGSARERYDRHRARQLGVDVADLAKFTGRGAALHARIAGDQEAAGTLANRGGQDATFATSAAQTLDGLAAAVRAAERMPTARRKAAHRAVTAELDGLERGLMDRLGVHSFPTPPTS